MDINDNTVRLARDETSPVVPQKPEEEGIELGVSLNLPFITPYEDDWEIYHRDDISIDQLMAMRQNDPQAQALYRLITLPILIALKGATFLPEKGEEGGDEEAKFIEQMLTLPASSGGMTTPFGVIIRQMLMAVFNGFSAFELVYWSPKHGPLKGKWTLKKIAHRPAETVTFLVDQNGDYRGIRQRAWLAGKTIDIKIPGDKAVYFTVQGEERPFYGRSMFQAAFKSYDKKQRLYYIAHLAAQKAAIGTRIGRHPDNPDRTELANFKKSLRDFGVAQWMTMPEKYMVESLQETGRFDFLGFINHHNSQMSKSILAPFFDDNQGAGVSDGAMVDFGKQSNFMFLMMLESIMEGMADVINYHIIPRFIDWNFGTSRYPTFVWGTFTEEQRREIRSIYERVVTGGNINATPEFLREMEKKMANYLGLPIDYDAIEKREKEEAEARAAAEVAGVLTTPEEDASVDTQESDPLGADNAPEQ